MFNIYDFYARLHLSELEIHYRLLDCGDEIRLINQIVNNGVIIYPG